MVKEEADVNAHAVYFYQAFSFICFAGFITFLILYLVLADNPDTLGPNSGTNCPFKPITNVSRSGFQGPYSMTFDQTTGTAMMATFTSSTPNNISNVRLSAANAEFGTETPADPSTPTTTETQVFYRNFMYTLQADGTVSPNFEGLSSVASDYAFNTKPRALVPVTVVSSSLGVVTDGEFFWSFTFREEISSQNFALPGVPDNDGGTQTMTIASVQEWNTGVVVQYVTENVDNSPAGAESRLKVLTKVTDFDWEATILSPLDPGIPLQGQFGQNLFSVSNVSIAWGADPLYVYDFNPNGTWELADTSNIDIKGAFAINLTRSGLELFVLTGPLSIQQYTRISADPTGAANLRQFYLKNSYVTNLTANQGYQMRVNDVAVIISDETSQVQYYRRTGEGAPLSLDQTLDVSTGTPGAVQNNVIALTQTLPATRVQFLSVPICTTCTSLDTDQVAFYSDACTS